MEYEIGPDEATSTAVVRAVSAVEGRDPLSLRPLADVIDPEALNRLFGSRYDGTARPGGRLTFAYSGYWITIENGEYLALRPIDSRAITERRPGPTDCDVR